MSQSRSTSAEADQKVFESVEMSPRGTPNELPAYVSTGADVPSSAGSSVSGDYIDNIDGVMSAGYASQAWSHDVSFASSPGNMYTARPGSSPAQSISDRRTNSYQGLQISDIILNDL